MLLHYCIIRIRYQIQIRCLFEQQMRSLLTTINDAIAAACGPWADCKTSTPAPSLSSYFHRSFGLFSFSSSTEAAGTCAYSYPHWCSSCLWCSSLHMLPNHHQKNASRSSQESYVSPPISRFSCRHAQSMMLPMIWRTISRRKMELGMVGQLPFADSPWTPHNKKPANCLLKNLHYDWKIDKL